MPQLVLPTGQEKECETESCNVCLEVRQACPEMQVQSASLNHWRAAACPCLTKQRAVHCSALHPIHSASLTHYKTTSTPGQNSVAPSGTPSHALPPNTPSPHSPPHLAHDADLCPEPPGVQLPQVAAVHQDAAGGGVIQPLQQRHQRCLRAMQCIDSGWGRQTWLSSLRFRKRLGAN
jgi:hypothetical protein